MWSCDPPLPAGDARSQLMKLVHVVSSPLAVRVMLGGQLRFLRESRFRRHGGFPARHGSERSSGE